MDDSTPVAGFDPATALQELEQLNASLGGLLGRFQQLSGSTEAPITGTDPSGIVTAQLSPTGALTRLEVERDWKARIQPTELAVACSDAVTAAVTARTAELQSDPARTAPAPVPAPPEPATDPRSLQQISDETDRIMREALAYAPPPTPEQAPVHQRVSVQLVGPQAIVYIDPDWAKSTTTTALNAELAAALEASPPDRGPDMSALTDMNRQLEGLFAEAMAHLHKLI